MITVETATSNRKMKTIVKITSTPETIVTI